MWDWTGALYATYMVLAYLSLAAYGWSEESERSTELASLGTHLAGVVSDFVHVEDTLAQAYSSDPKLRESVLSSCLSLEKLAGENPKDEHSLHGYAVIKDAVGMLEYRSEKLPIAGGWFEKARGTNSALTELRPDSPLHLENFARSSLRTILVHLELGNPAGARQRLPEVARALARGRKAFGDAWATEKLVLFDQMGHAYRQLEQWQEADAVFGTCADLLPSASDASSAQVIKDWILLEFLRANCTGRFQPPDEAKRSVHVERLGPLFDLWDEVAQSPDEDVDTVRQWFADEKGG